jgi:hypothetical protein
MRRALHPILASGLVGLALASGAWAGAKEPAPFRVLPGPYSKKAIESRGGGTTSHFSIKGLAITVEFLEPDARASFLRKAASGASDPFAVPPGRPEIYHAVRVVFENRSTGDVVFQPGNVMLLTDRKAPQYAMDLTDLYRAAAHADIDPDQVFDRLSPAIFDSSTEIPKGRTIERLLVFGPFPPKWKELRVNFSFLQIGAETHSVSFMFHRQPVGG